MPHRTSQGRPVGHTETRPGEHATSEVPAPPSSITVGERDQSMLRPLLREVVEIVGESGGDYRALLDDVEAGAVASERIQTLERFLELGLHTGRFRARFGGLGEESLIRLFHQTPRGATLVAAIGEVNRALGALTGQTIEHLSLTDHGPNRYALAIETDRCHLSLRIEPTGVRVGDLELTM